MPIVLYLQADAENVGSEWNAQACNRILQIELDFFYNVTGSSFGCIIMQVTRVVVSNNIANTHMVCFAISSASKPDHRVLLFDPSLRIFVVVVTDVSVSPHAEAGPTSRILRDG